VALIASDRPDDASVVVTEVIDHLAHLDQREIATAKDLTEAWFQLRTCDSAVLDSLGPSEQHHYQALIDAPRLRSPHSRRADRSALHPAIARLHTAIRRRLALLDGLAV